ncbi:MAG: hypothetical protein F2813_02195 [Actinobacteria bacterium]|uniref:Unannotated protein n=1 Tax=freshwater metagenome TaxID=449393 RepID=A0A6J5ZEB9_9ZZZZ|nr:hypothetical protein [Actinomycetota bacterium]
MSNLPLFIAGLMVTLIVAAAGALLVYAAVLDGRYERDQQDESTADHG